MLNVLHKKCWNKMLIQHFLSEVAVHIAAFKTLRLAAHFINMVYFTPGVDK